MSDEQQQETTASQSSVDYALTVAIALPCALSGTLFGLMLGTGEWLFALSALCLVVAAIGIAILADQAEGRS